MIRESYETIVKIDHGLRDETLLRVFDDQSKAFGRGQLVPKSALLHRLATHIQSSDRAQSLKP